MSFLRLSALNEPDDEAFRLCPDIPARKITKLLFLIASVFLLFHLTAFYLVYNAPIDSSLFRLVVEGLDLNNEATVSTWYSSMTLFICAITLGSVALAAWQDRSRYLAHWLALSLLAFLFSLDEIAGLHEKLNGPVKMVVHAGGVFTFAWVIPGLIFVALLLISFRSFYHSLPSHTRFYLGLGAALYFLGSLGFEMVSGEYSSAYGRDDFGYKALTGFEEFLEMAGVATILHGILEHLNRQVSWSIQRQNPRAEPVASVVETSDKLPLIATPRRSTNE